MGTRGLLGFYANGKPLLTYSQYDTYPEGMGLEALAYVQNNLVQTPKGWQFDLGKLEQIFALVEVDQNDEPTAEQLAIIGKKYWQDVSTGKDWYSYLRSCQGDLDMYLQAGFIPVTNEFGRDSLFCENTYVINVDDRTLDYYEGFNAAPVEGDHFKPETEGIWAGIEIPVTETGTRDDGSTYTLSNKYGVVVRTVRFPFDQLADWRQEEKDLEINPEDVSQRKFLQAIRIAPRARDRDDHLDADGNYVEESADV